MPYQSTKRYGHEQGLSATFRQHRALSHCNLLHGYALAFTLIFEAEALDGRNWVVDFGALKAVKQGLVDGFDHKTVIAADDPLLPDFQRLAVAGGIDLAVVPDVGCEAFARSVYAWVASWLELHYLPSLKEAGIKPPHNLKLVSCECAEHGANSAIYTGPSNY